MHVWADKPFVHRVQVSMVLWWFLSVTFSNPIRESWRWKNGYEFHCYETNLIVIDILRISNMQLLEVWTLYVILLNQIFQTKTRIACWLVVAVNYLMKRIERFWFDVSHQQIKSWILSFGKFLSRNPKIFYMEPKEKIFFLIARLKILFECIQCCFISKNNFNTLQGIIFNHPWPMGNDGILSFIFE